MSPSYQDRVLELSKEINFAVTLLILDRLGLGKEEALKVLNNQLEEFKQALLEVPIMQDVFKEWEERAIEKGLENGLEKGLKVGQEMVKKKMAKSMLKEGMDKALITKITGLKPEELEQL